MRPEVRVGISGWRYAPWRGKFYPEDLRQADELNFAARKFSTIEINGTFYSLQRPQSFAAWHDATPEDFVFAVKGARYITHMKRLKDVDAALANFFASGLLALKEKLGPILWQLPPSMAFDPARLAAFFARLPRDTRAAARLARRHEAKMEGRTHLKAGGDRPIRHALEVRHDSFRNPDFIALLRRHDIALVAADAVAWPLLMDVTADFVYCRLHGSQELYVSGYESQALGQWARRIEAWLAGAPAKGPHAGPPSRRKVCKVYVYFDNDAKVRAPADAAALTRLLQRRGLPVVMPSG